MPITPSTTPTEQLDRLLRQFPALSPTAQQQLTALYPLYQEWNARINVISRRDIDNLYLHHVMHSLALAWLLPNEPTSYITPVSRAAISVATTSYHALRCL